MADRDPDVDAKASRIVITDEETCRLAGEMARLTGETITEAITVGAPGALGT